MKGDYAYFVKWKGYGESENNWVAESDAGCIESSFVTITPD